MEIKKLFFTTLSAFIVLTFFTYSEANAEKECFEKVSRGIFKFNQGLDDVILEPVAKAYNKLPEPIREGTSNFTSNIATLLSIPNHLLQGEFRLAGHATGSFVVNTSICLNLMNQIFTIQA